jgi:hypothetical protein
MSQVTIVTCDRCDCTIHTKQLKGGPEPEQLWEVGVLSACKAPTGNGLPMPITKSQMWRVPAEHKMECCRTCVEDMGLVPVLDPERVVAATPTLEDLIIEIVEESVQNAMEP